MPSMMCRRKRVQTGRGSATFVSALALLATSIACSENEPTMVKVDAPLASLSPCKPLHCGLTVPAWFGAFSSTVSVTRAGDTIVLKSDGVPDHKSPYFAPTDSRFERYTGTNPKFKRNPNHIAAHSLTFRIPANPTTSATRLPTDLGPIGVALNGVPLYNQYAAAWTPLSNESDSFDQYNGHPEGGDLYHYHWEPLWLTRSSKEALVGVLLDGFPVYGPEEGGKVVASSSLDARTHGHFGRTAEFPLGIYHYHTTTAFPYINAGLFAGHRGTVTY